jgi:hypothetical protein
MTCTTVNLGGQTFTVCGPPQGIVRRSVQHCPTCQRRRRFVVRWGGAWHGSSVTCCACGDSWADGERYPRPFRRGWRKDATARARAAWVAALPVAEYHARCQADVDDAVRSFEDHAETAELPA